MVRSILNFVTFTQSFRLSSHLMKIIIRLFFSEEKKKERGNLVAAPNGEREKAILEKFPQAENAETLRRERNCGKFSFTAVSCISFLFILFLIFSFTLASYLFLSPMCSSFIISAYVYVCYRYLANYVFVSRWCCLVCLDVHYSFFKHEESARFTKENF